jgi:protoporphyrinogen oxidase
VEVILKLLKLRRESTETDAEFFHYPRRGFGDLPRAMAEEIARHGGRILVSARIEGVDRDDGHIRFVRVGAGGEHLTLPAAYVVSSIPLPALGQLVIGDRDPEFSRAVTGLHFRHLVLVYLFLKVPQVLEDHWIFFPERDFIFSRVFEQKQMSPELGPPDRTVLCCDFTCSEEDATWRQSDDELAARCASGLARARFISKDDVQGHLVKRSRNFYPVYDREYADKMRTVSRALQRTDNLLTTGRIVMYNYNNSDHCVDMGRFIAEGLVQGEPAPRIWERLEQRVATYKIVD